MNVDEAPDPATPTAETVQALAEVLLRVCKSSAITCMARRVAVRSLQHPSHPWRTVSWRIQTRIDVIAHTIRVGPVVFATVRPGLGAVLALGPSGRDFHRWRIACRAWRGRT